MIKLIVGGLVITALIVGFSLRAESPESFVAGSIFTMLLFSIVVAIISWKKYPK